MRPEPPILASARIPGFEPHRCAVVYATPEGACVSSSVELPDLFVLHEVNSPTERICRVVWRQNELLGVEYVNARTVGWDKKAIPENWGAFALYPT